MDGSVSPSWPVRALALLIVFLLLAPIGVIVPISFSGVDYLQFPPETWSLRWYRNYFGSSSWTGATLTSLKVAFLSMLLATVIGTLAALAVRRVTKRYSDIILGISIMPLVIPHIILAISLYFLFVQLRMSGTLLSFVIAHTVISVPLVLISVLTSLSRFDARLEDAAFSLGAGHIYTLRRITLPNILPGIATGALLAFLTSFDEVVIAIFLAGTRMVTLPKRMWDGLWLEITPAIAAAATIVLLVTLVVLVSIYLLRISLKAPERPSR